jgi:hypothetical protein
LLLRDAHLLTFETVLTHSIACLLALKSARLLMRKTATLLTLDPASLLMRKTPGLLAFETASLLTPRAPGLLALKAPRLPLRLESAILLTLHTHLGRGKAAAVTMAAAATCGKDWRAATTAMAVTTAATSGKGWCAAPAAAAAMTMTAAATPAPGRGRTGLITLAPTTGFRCSRARNRQSGDARG